MTNIPGENEDLFAQDLTVDELANDVAAGFTTAGSFATGGSASCPASSVSSGSSFSSAGG